MSAASAAVPGFRGGEESASAYSNTRRVVSKIETGCEGVKATWAVRNVRHVACFPSGCCVRERRGVLEDWDFHYNSKEEHESVEKGVAGGGHVSAAVVIVRVRKSGP